MRTDSDNGSWGNQLAVPAPVFTGAPARNSYDISMQEETVLSDLQRHYRTVRSHPWLLAAAITGCGLSGLWLGLREKPVFRSSAMVEVTGMRDPASFSRIDTAGNGAQYPDEGYVQTQIELLRSKALLQRVLTTHGLFDPTAPSPAVPEEVEPSRNLLQRATAAFSKRPSDPVLRAAEALTIRANRQTRVIEIAYESTNPQIAAKVANGLATEFIEQARETQWRSNQENSDWLRSKLDELRRKLTDSESQLQQYASNSGLLYASDKTSISMDKLRQVQTELSRAQAELASRRVRFDAAATAPPDSLSEVIDDPALREHQSKLAELKRQVAEMGILLTPENYKLARVKAQVQELEGLFQKQRSYILQRIQVEYEAARRREQMLSQAYAQQAKVVHADEMKGIRYDQLRREAEGNRQLYDSLLQKIKESSVASALNANNIRVVDPARTPVTPVRPNIPLNVFLGLVSGLFIGLTMVFVVDGKDKSLKTPGEGPSYLNVPELGAIPNMDSDPSFCEGKKLQKKQTVQRMLDVSEPVVAKELIPWQSNQSMLAESVRATAMSLLFARGYASGPRVVVITSTKPKEGKSTISANLAVAMARLNRRTLLIDGDMRRPRLHHVFGLEGKSGLRQVLTGTVDLDEVQIKDLAYNAVVPNLFVLPAGVSGDESMDCLYSERMIHLLRCCRREFDNVIIDSPPMMQIPDARVLGRLADGVILLVRAEETPRDLAQAAIGRFVLDGTPILGTILNQWNPTKKAVASYYQYYRSAT